MNYADWIQRDGEFTEKIGRFPGKTSTTVSVPFVEMQNGDFLALDIEADAEVPPVVYLVPDLVQDDDWLIARSFDDFLKQWEDLCYIGPEIALLGELCDERTGMLDVDSRRAEALRCLFAAAMTISAG